MGVKESAIKQFGKQAEAYSRANIFVDVIHLDEVISRTGVTGKSRVLDIATGAGFLALLFARSAYFVIGCDITRNMLQKACQKKEREGLLNIGFCLSDAESLAFPDGAFDIVSCRFAFHHFPDPVKALHEMMRVCKPGGRIVLVDGVSSEDKIKSIFHNSIEKMRDPSHVKIYSMSEITGMLEDTEIIDIVHWDIHQDFDEWMGRAGADEETKKRIEGLMRESINGDTTGLRVKENNGSLGFIYDTIMIGECNQFC